jgi:hypothetical protein
MQRDRHKCKPKSDYRRPSKEPPALLVVAINKHIEDIYVEIMKKDESERVRKKWLIYRAGSKRKHLGITLDQLSPLFQKVS